MHFEADAPDYETSPDLSNIENIGQFPSLTEEQRQYLAQNGFVAVPQTVDPGQGPQYRHIHDILEENHDNGIPSFVSSDALLNAFHRLYDLALRESEQYTFWDLMGNLTQTMVEVSYQQYQAAPAGRWRDAALRNVMFFTTAMQLMDNSTPMHAEVRDAVEHVLSLIYAHDSVTADWFQGYEHDFTQYVPRGHYTRTEVLKRYFRAMMWYGRVMFRLQPTPDDPTNAQGKYETAQAILISLALREPVPGLGSGVSGYDIWDMVYGPTAFFVGVADDLLPSEYLNLVTEVYGTDPGLSDLDDEVLLDEFIERALTLRQPRILGSVLNDDSNITQTMGMRFMGQRFIPDSYVLSQLVYVHVGNATSPRLMPKGLDVMAALGSDRAWELLQDERQYQHYESQMALMQSYIRNLTAEDWTQNLYWLWLYSLLPLLQPHGEGYPLFMRSQAWTDKQLATALASWTELRHDTVLYAKQSYTWRLVSAPESTRGYVEPVPHVYARLASLVDMMYRGLDRRGLLVPEIRQRLETLRVFLNSLTTIAVKELTGTPLNQTEFQTIVHSGSILKYLVEYPSMDDPMSAETDSRMALVTDVHTDPNTDRVLEEGVGDPLLLYVVCKVLAYDGEHLLLTRGGAYSYYEFTQPTSNRLNDAEWQAMLTAGSTPPMPAWLSSFIAGADIGTLAVTPVGMRQCLHAGLWKTGTARSRG